MGQDVELWETELEEAGWKKWGASVYQSPSGHLFRGPYGAWCKMLSFPELNQRKNGSDPPPCPACAGDADADHTC
jgi:hypothetical protein